MTGQPAPGRASRLAGIEALRGMAAVCVVLLHLQATLRGHPPVFGKGYLAVDFFLMLSGFLMARTQEGRFAALAEAQTFMAKRIRRLWPMMALGGLIGAPVLLIRSEGPGHFLSLALPNLALLPASFDNLAYPLNIPAWTIFYELLANLLHILLFRRFGRRGLLVSGLICLAAMVPVALTFGSFDVGARPQHFGAALPRVLLAYLIGMALGRWWKGDPTIRMPFAPALIAMPALFAVAWWFGWTGWIFDLAFVLIACPLIIAGGLTLAGSPRLAVWAGILSFPLFAVHMPILQAARQFGLGYVVGGSLALAGGIGVAIGSRLLAGRRAPPERIPA